MLDPITQQSGQRNAASPFLDCYAGQTVVGIGAHPDDLELGMGGTLARLSRAGVKVIMAIVSIPNHLELRREEARNAAQILGCDVRLLRPDRCSRVEDLKMYELVQMVDDLVREYSPAALFSHCLANHHVDHKLVHNACVASQRLNYFDFFCYSPTSCRTVSIDFHPQVYIDIGDTIDLKMDAIRAHHSQFGARGLRTDQCKESDSHTGKFVGIDYAEGIEIVRMRLR